MTLTTDTIEFEKKRRNGDEDQKVFRLFLTDFIRILLFSLSLLFHSKQDEEPNGSDLFLFFFRFRFKAILSQRVFVGENLWRLLIACSLVIHITRSFIYFTLQFIPKRQGLCVLCRYQYRDMYGQGNGDVECVNVRFFKSTSTTLRGFGVGIILNSDSRTRHINLGFVISHCDGFEKKKLRFFFHCSLLSI